MARNSKIPLSVEGGGLARYLKEIAPNKPLPRAEEVELGRRIQAGDEQAKMRLIEANLRFVVSIAKEYRGQGMLLADLISEGNLGLIGAAGRFDPSRGFKFISYAVWWIRQAILKALAEKSRQIRIPQNQGVIRYRIFKTNRRLEQEIGHSPSSVEIAGELGLALEQVDDIRTISRKPVSLDALLWTDEDSLSLLDVIADESQPCPENEAIGRFLREEIEGVLDTLEPREAEIIRLYYGLEGQGPMKLDDIGKRYGLTRERVRQIREKALSRLRHPSRRGRLEEFWED